jgi:hypothetical protein
VIDTDVGTVAYPGVSASHWCIPEGIAKIDDTKAAEHTLTLALEKNELIRAYVLGYT